MEYFNIIAIVVCLVLSAFFSGTEIAFVSANKLYFELQKKQGVRSGKIIAGFFKKPSMFIATMLVGNTCTLVLYGIFMADVLDPVIIYYLGNYPVITLILQSVLSTLVVLVTAEFLPKTIFLLNSDRLLEVLAIPIQLAYWVMWIFVYVIVGLSKLLIVYVFKLNYAEDEPVYKLVDLNHYINNTLASDSQEDIPDIDKKIFTNAILFKSVKVRECMVPRTEIVAVEVEDNIEKLQKAFLESGHSKILVYRENIDDIIGYCHSLQMFNKPQNIRSILTNIIIIPATTPAQELLVRFISENKSIALVVDEFGGTSGVVTLEDVMEEIFGEIQDEYDQEDWIEQKIDEYNYILSARHEIDYLNEKYGWKIPEGEYETLGGFILDLLENIPKTSETIVSEPYMFTILTMHHSRIDTIKLSVKKGKNSKGGKSKGK